MQSIEAEEICEFNDVAGTDAASTAILELLRHVHDLAQEAGKDEMAAVVKVALRRCVNLHVAEKRHALEEVMVLGRIQ